MGSVPPCLSSVIRSRALILASSKLRDIRLDVWPPAGAVHPSSRGSACCCWQPRLWPGRRHELVLGRYVESSCLLSWQMRWNNPANRSDPSLSEFVAVVCLVVCRRNDTAIRENHAVVTVDPRRSTVCLVGSPHVRFTPVVSIKRPLVAIVCPLYPVALFLVFELSTNPMDALGCVCAVCRIREDVVFVTHIPIRWFVHGSCCQAA